MITYQPPSKIQQSTSEREEEIKSSLTMKTDPQWQWSVVCCLIGVGYILRVAIGFWIWFLWVWGWRGKCTTCSTINHFNACEGYQKVDQGCML